MTRIIAAFTILVICSSVLSAQSITGLWKTIDDQTGETKAEVDISIKNGKLYGKIVKLYAKKGVGSNPICIECPGNRKGKRVVGMTIITALEKDGDEWEADDAILDPESGKIYDCKIWLDEDNKDLLNVRGYIGFLFRTQTWQRVK